MRLRRDRLSVRNASTGALFDDEPLIALSDEPRPRVLAIGTAARAAGARCVNPFQHPRILIADFLVAEVLLKYAYRAVSPHGWLVPSPVAVGHVLERLDGGLSQIERRALMELLEGAGARSAFLWEGRELTDAELHAGAYRTAVPS